MKKILSIVGTILLIGTGTTSLVACNKLQYSEDDLKKEKEKNNIKTKDGILEWITPQEKPFNQVDDKWYFVVWHCDENSDWRIVKFKNNAATIKIDNVDNRQLGKIDLGMGRDLYITNQTGFIKYVTLWSRDDGTYFKSVYY